MGPKRPETNDVFDKRGGGSPPNAGYVHNNRVYHNSDLGIVQYGGTADGQLGLFQRHRHLSDRQRR